MFGVIKLIVLRINMGRKELQQKTVELVEHAWYLHRYTHEDADVEEA